MITHFGLCKKTAEWIIKKSHVCVLDYQSYASSEFPDVLSFKNSISTLFEIKVSRSDFLSDNKKDCRQGLKDYRVKYKSYYYGTWKIDINGNRQYVKKLNPGFTETYRQKPHLGVYRYYVCPYGMIKPEEIELFGLYWYREKDGKFFKKKDSKKFRRDLYEENGILVHALRKLNNTGVNDLLLTGAY